MNISHLSNEELVQRYRTEAVKLKTLNAFGRWSSRFLGYPNTYQMNRCQHELRRRNVPLPLIHLP
jgi:hypothetical protein